MTCSFWAPAYPFFHTLQGQNYVVDVMMKAGLPERETFCLFLYLLRQGHLHGIYRKEV